jgi:hypothetical protein
VLENPFLSLSKTFFMIELTLQVEDSKYNQLLQFLNTIDYIKILTQLQQSNAADTEKKVSSNAAPTRQKNKKIIYLHPSIQPKSVLQKSLHFVAQ